MMIALADPVYWGLIGVALLVPTLGWGLPWLAEKIDTKECKKISDEMLAELDQNVAAKHAAKPNHQ